MKIHRSNQSIPPIIKQPQHDPDVMKTPTQKKLEYDNNFANDTVKKMARQSTNKVYEMLRKVAQNTEFNVSYSVGNMNEVKQFKFNLKKDGQEIVSIPPDVAVQIAERAKSTTVGLLIDHKA